MKNMKTRIAKLSAIALLSVGAMALSASAAIDLSSADLSSISSAVSNAIASAKASLPANATPAQVDAAIAAAISNEAQALITQYGQTDPMLVAEAVITASTQAGANPMEIGKGMADAALVEPAATGLEIADAVGATAPKGAVAVFQRTAVESGPRGITLADAAVSYENVGAGGQGGNSQGGGGGNGNTGGFFGGGGNSQGGGGGGGCRNPSCT